MKKGFTLVEMSIVLIIIGLLAGGSIQMMSVLSKKAKVTEAKQQLETLKESIIGFMQANNGALPTQAQFGTLGNIIDPWGKRINYYNIDNSSNSLCAYVSTYNSVATPNYPSIANIGFILISSGENYNMQTDMLNDLKLYTQGAANIDDNNSDISGTRLEEYDDLFILRTLSELKVLINCNQNKLQIINPELQIGHAGSPYQDKFIATKNGVECLPAECQFTSITVPSGLILDLDGTLRDADNNASTTNASITVNVKDVTMTPNPTISRTYKLLIN